MGEATGRIEMKPVSLLDGPLTFAGAVSLEVDGAVHPWRLPHDRRDLFDPGLVEKHGDRNLHYVDGLTIFGREDEEYLADEVHPGDDGQHFVADCFSELVMLSRWGTVIVWDDHR